MKKIVIVLLALLCAWSSLLSFAGCDATTTASITKAIEKTVALDGYDAKLTMDVTSEAAGISATIPLRVSIKTKDLKSQQPKMLAVSEVTVLNRTSTTTVYSAGEWYYVSADGVEFKARAEKLTAEYDYTSDISDLVQALPEKVMEKAEIVKADGATTVKVSLTGEEMSQIFADLTKEISDQLTASADGIAVDAIHTSKWDTFAAMREGEVQITVRDGYVQTYALAFGMQVSVLGVETETSVSMTLSFNAPGEDVTVNPPYGYEKYPEYDFQ